jgi:hypothetical protein
MAVQISRMQIASIPLVPEYLLWSRNGAVVSISRCIPSSVKI